MTEEQALSWLQQVDGRLYRTKKNPRNRDSWVAVVRVPGRPQKRGKLIIALGESLSEAARAAEQQWQTLWENLSNIH